MATLTREPFAARDFARRDEATEALWVTYRYMTLGLVTTGLVAFGIARTPTVVEAVIENPLLFYGALIVQLVMVFAFNAVATRASTAVTAAMFFAYAALTGVTFSVLFLVYTAESIATTFFITAGAFAGLSVFGATTHKDLSAIGRFGLFALIGLILASIVNIFVGSSTLQWVISIVGVVLFAGLTAYDTQRLKALFAEHGTAGNLALVGALTLYLDFINMFMFLLRIMGGRRSS